MNDHKEGVRLEGVVKKFDTFIAVNDITLEAKQGEFLTLLGPSGSGKTTTLRIISGLEFPTRGQVYVNGLPVSNEPAYKRDLGMVFQNYALFPHMTIFENIAFPLKMRKHSRIEVEKKVANALKTVKLQDLGHRYPKQLSGGQQQRIALARALVYEPSVLLMDEPLGALDKKLREEMQLEVKQIQEQFKITTIYVTHDQSEALTMSDRIALMNEGKIEQIGTPSEIYEMPSSKFVADFIGESNFFEGNVIQLQDQWCKIETQKGLELRARVRNGLEKGQHINLTIRPEKIHVLFDSTGKPNVFKGKIVEVIYLGDTIKYLVRLDSGDQLIVKSQNNVENLSLHKGGDIFLNWDFEDFLIV